ncbi:uncharacterized protein K441DRAFT_678812 [Cenococcum geophilum 1.58]|uniref:uncharacterized protein n=1 Tax=Cenococcum geophilum 1.58 TaxID=794803 RepID=UPI003590074B|nr:hypothetical protein K441DRAFT_678812 [Cenococcum geophilum 1.58]
MTTSWPFRQLRVPTQNDLHFEPAQLRRLPAELRLVIFCFVFDENFGRDHRILLCRDSSSLEFLYSEALQRTCPYLDSRLVGLDVATEAAEAFYRSGIHLYSGLGQLLNVLEHCPLSSNATPGRFVTCLRLSIDEDVEYTGDNIGRHSLRKADWVLLDDQDNERMLQPRRSQLMRRCSKVVLKMPKLKIFHLLIKPADEWKSEDKLSLWEMRDCVPIIFRLRARGINACAFLKVMPSIGNLNGSKQKVNETRYINSTVDVSMCFPFYNPINNGLSDHGGIVHVGEGVYSRNSHSWEQSDIRRRNAEALRELFSRLAADKRLDYVDGDFRRVVKKNGKRGPVGLGPSTEQAQKKARKS